MPKSGIWLAGDLALPAAVELGERADQAGVDSVWAAEAYCSRDAWTTLSAIAVKTERVMLATGVIPVFTRHPALIAMSVATLDELSNGRAIAGIGSGERDSMADQFNYDFSSPLTAMREAISIIKSMLRGETLDFSGRVFSARGVRLSSVRVRREIPLYAAAVGPKMCRLVGEVADGVYYPQTSPQFIAQANTQVQAGLDKAGRPDGSVDYAAMIIASVHEDAAVARQIPKALLAILLAVPEGEHILEHNQLDPAAAPLIRQALARGGPREAAGLVTEDMVGKLTTSGTAGEVTEQVEALLDAGLTHPVLSAIGPHAANVIPVAARFASRD